MLQDVHFIHFSHINEDKRKTEGRVQMFEVLRDIEECPVSVMCIKEMTSARMYVCMYVRMLMYIYVLNTYMHTLICNIV